MAGHGPGGLREAGAASRISCSRDKVGKASPSPSHFLLCAFPFSSFIFFTPSMPEHLVGVGEFCFS